MEHTKDNTEQHATTTNITEEQKQLKDAAKTAEQDRQVKWENRVDVVYHFFAYRYFDRSTTCLDLLNFSDADVDSFNLTANKTRGLNNWHVCAEYLQALDTPTLETTTHRRKFIYHVREYNRTQKPHSRFYLRNLTADDVEYVEGLCKQESNITVGEVKQPSMLIWASSCVEDEVLEEAYEEDLEGTGAVDHVEVAVEKCLEDNYKKLREKADKQAKTIRDGLTKEFEQLAVKSGIGSGKGDTKDTADS